MPETAGTKEWIIQHTPHGGDYALFWKPDSKGYTVRLEEAGLYTEEEARSIAMGRPETDVAFLHRDVQTRVVQTVPVESMVDLVWMHVHKNRIPHVPVVEMKVRR